MTTRRTLGLIAIPLLLAGCGATHTAQPASGHAPPEAAAMTCGPELGGQLTQVLGLGSPPANRATWRDGLYTCTWDLPMGPLVLSVRVSGSDERAAAYFDTRRSEIGQTEPLAGLGKRAFGTATGTVLLIKDDMTLTVDASGLPAVFGANGQRRSDLAYEVASDVLGCWTGDE